MNKQTAQAHARVAVAAYSDGFADAAKRGEKRLVEKTGQLQDFYRNAILETVGVETYAAISTKVAEAMNTAVNGDPSSPLLDLMHTIDDLIKRGSEKDNPDAKQQDLGDHLDPDEFHLADDQAEQEPAGSEQDDPDVPADVAAEVAAPA